MKNSVKIPAYEEQVYAAVLGKIIGVYLGRPYEGWSKDAIEKKWGEITRYVHEDQGVPLVVADDDISGTFTFVKILEDSGLYADTPPELFGENWLNFLMEYKTVLWWGGVSHSTEHTAFQNLKNGVPSPQSGSAALNGREVAEQIGAQIFIDAFGMVAPGDPTLAATLARRAASVSHDGEAVHAAVVVAAMVSLGFVHHDITKLLDEAIKFIPADSQIAAIHRNVRKWAKQDRDWRKTYERIDAEYGYAKFGGNCHIAPNHAIMVMAWAYSRNNFFEAMKIICTAGWDTDCNAANVGSVMALVVGLDHICDDYDFRTPFADRVIIPTAEGTDSITDAALIAAKIARIGRRMCLAADLRSAGRCTATPLHNFALPGAMHGYQPDTNAVLSWHEKALAVRFVAAPNAPASFGAYVSNPDSKGGGGYRTMTTPWLYGGQTVTAKIKDVKTDGAASVRFYVQDQNGVKFHSAPKTLANGKPMTLRWQVPADVFPIVRFGFEVGVEKFQPSTRTTPSSGAFSVDSVDFTGTPSLSIAAFPAGSDRENIPGFISNIDNLRGAFSNDTEALTHFGKNEGVGVIVTGNRDWTDTAINSRFAIHAAKRAGFVVRYQGLRRYYAVVFTKTHIQIIKRHYSTETVLAETPFTAPENTPFDVAVSAHRHTIQAKVGDITLTARDTTFPSGGAGFFIEQGLAGFGQLTIDN
ncbi:MAG: ADP-ribosylglycohydrolase family protein [Kiritimatiellaeota bacterium]|nr:ADP-ribosylglycohydrolase family protein [Kiritimatiellota bacterium]